MSEVIYTNTSSIMRTGYKVTGGKYRSRDPKTGRFVGKSLVERMIPMEDLQNLGELKIQQLILLQDEHNRRRLQTHNEAISS